MERFGSLPFDDLNEHALEPSGKPLQLRGKARSNTDGQDEALDGIGVDAYAEQPLRGAELL